MRTESSNGLCVPGAPCARALFFPALAFALGVLYADPNPENPSAKLSDLVRAVHGQRLLYLGRKDPDRHPECLTRDGKVLVTKEGDLYSEFIERFYNPFVTLTSERARARKLLEEFRTWVGRLRQSMVRQHQALEEARAASSQPARNWAETASTLPGAVGTIGKSSVQALHATKEPDRAETLDAWTLELKCVLDTFSGVNRWMIQMTEWLEEDADLAVRYLQSHPEFSCERGIADLPGGEAILNWRKDLGALQRWMEEAFSKRWFGKRPRQGDSARWLPPSVRPFFVELRSQLGNGMASNLLDEALQDPPDRMYLAHQFWKYADPEIARTLAESLRRWEKSVTGLSAATPEGRRTLREQLLGVLHYRQGAVHTGWSATERFLPELVRASLPEVLAPEDAFRQTHQKTQELLTGMEYAGTRDLAESFRERKADCFRTSQMAGCLLANAGYGEVYPLMTTWDAKGHLVTAFGAEELVVRDCGQPLTREKQRRFPRDFLDGGFVQVSRWVRTVDSWIDADVLVPAERKLYRKAVPYAGLTSGVTTLPPDPK